MVLSYIKSLDDTLYVGQAIESTFLKSRNSIEKVDTGLKIRRFVSALKPRGLTS